MVTLRFDHEGEGGGGVITVDCSLSQVQNI